MSSNKKATGDYYRNIIQVISTNIVILHDERQKYGRFLQFVKGINRNLRDRKRQLNYYENLLSEYIKEGRAE